MPAWLIFTVSSAAVVLAGTRLARTGDVIADRTGMGRTWVGAILIAAATSLPELTTDSFAVVQGHGSLAVGDLVGSSMANMLLLAVADIALTRVRVLTRVAINQAIVGTLALILTAIAVAGALTRARFVDFRPWLGATGYRIQLHCRYATDLFESRRPTLRDNQ